MLNKKLFIAAIISTLLLGASANAKTEGSHIGLNLIKSDIKANELTLGGSEYLNSEGFLVRSEDKISFGLNYGYSFNFDNFFVTPSIFLDYSSLSTVGDVPGGAKTSFDLDYRIGAKANIGYDITDNISAYLIGGFAGNKYKSNWAFNGNSSETRAFDTSFLYGLGASYKISDNISANLEYERSEIDMEVTTLPDTNQNFDLQVIRVGVAYNF
jgi:outer membrane autotransporter protein